MKKAVLTLTIVAALAFSLTGCAKARPHRGQNRPLREAAHGEPRAAAESCGQSAGPRGGAAEKNACRSGAGSGGEAGKGARPEAGKKRAEAGYGLCPDVPGAACSCGGTGWPDALEQSGRGGSKAPAPGGDPPEPGRGSGSAFERRSGLQQIIDLRFDIGELRKVGASRKTCLFSLNAKNALQNMRIAQSAPQGRCSACPAGMPLTAAGNIDSRKGSASSHILRIRRTFSHNTARFRREGTYPQGTQRPSPTL